MRYKDLITEASNLSTSEIKKYPERIQKFLSKIANKEPFELVSGGTVIIDPKDISLIRAFLSRTDVKGTLNLKTTDGTVISSSALKKTAEFGGLAGKQGKVANQGEVAEGILGAATLARLIKRPGENITVEEVRAIINELPNNTTGGKITKKAVGGDNISDVFTLEVKLKPATYKDFKDKNKWPIVEGLTKSIVKYVNSYVNKYGTFFEKNGRPDTVEVIADGVSNEVGSKVDVFMVYRDENGERRLQHFDLSAKTGTTMQIGQVGSGGAKATLDQSFEIAKALWQRFGVDLEPIRTDYINSKNTLQAYIKTYNYVNNQLKEKLASDKTDVEKAFLKQVINAIKYFGTLNDDRVKLVQFTKSGYYVLDFKKLDRLFGNNDIDLDSKIVIGDAGLPKIQIYDTVTGKDLITIRVFRSGSTGYLRNYIEKGKLLVALTKVREGE